MSIRSPLSQSSMSKRYSSYKISDSCDEFANAPYDDADLLLNYLAMNSYKRLTIYKTKIYDFYNVMYIAKYIHNSELESCVKQVCRKYLKCIFPKDSISQASLDEFSQLVIVQAQVILTEEDITQV